MEVWEFRPEKAHQRYVLKDGTEVLGASTIAKVDDDPSGLVYWANKLGQQGLNHEKVREAMAAAGNAAHHMIQCHFLRKTPGFKKLPPEAVETGTRIYEEFMSWWADNELTWLASERELMSEKYRYGGTLDVAAHDLKDRIWIIDIKTSKKVYPGHRYQIAGLGKLWEENENETVYKHMIVRLPQDGGPIQPYTLHNPKECFDTFLTQLAFLNAKEISG
jgi:hypothetical protein